jgi:hypothetical protein
MTHLLPCPFCGLPPTITRYSKPIGGGSSVGVIHIECGNDERCKVCVDIEHVNEAIAIEAWNTRPSHSQPCSEDGQ